MLILILLGIPFYAVVVFSLGYDFLFKSILGHCVQVMMKELERERGKKNVERKIFQQQS